MGMVVPKEIQAMSNPDTDETADEEIQDVV